MLFGRKTPPAAPPKPAGETAPEAVRPDAVRDEAAAAPPASQPAPAGQVPTGLTPPVQAAPIGSTQFPAPSRPPFSDKGPDMNTTPPKPPAGPSPASSFKPSDIPRRTVDLPGVQRKPDGYAIPTPPAPTPAPTPLAAPAPAPAVEQRRLIVGRDISLTGEIGSCDVLVVEGTVEAKLRDGRSIEIAENGLFKGSVEIDEADIGGRFEGDIAVRGRLTVRSTGKITGSIKYGELAVEAGGQLIGDIQVGGQVGGASAQKPAPVAEPAPAPAPFIAPAPEPVPAFSGVQGE